MDTLRVYNFTNTFNRPIRLYSLGEGLRLPVPVQVSSLLYFFVIGAVWYPLMWFIVPIPAWGVFPILPVLYFFVVVAPPFMVAFFAARRGFGGVTLLQALKNIGRFVFSEPKGWADFRPMPERVVKGRDSYRIEGALWLSRKGHWEKVRAAREAAVIRYLEERAKG